MAIWFVDSNSSGADDGTSWTDAFSTLDKAMDTAVNTTLAAGDFIYVHVGASSPHSETYTAGQTFGASGDPGTLLAPIIVLGVDRNNSDALTIETTNTITNNSNTAFASPFLYMYGLGIYLTANDIRLATGNQNAYQIFEQCRLELDENASSSNISIGGSGTGAYNLDVLWLNCRISTGRGTVSTGISMSAGTLRWKGGTLIESAVGKVRNIIRRTRASGRLIIEDVDLSLLDASDGYILEEATAAGSIIVRNCKLPATFSGLVRDAVPGGAMTTVDMIGCHTADTSDPNIQYQFKGAGIEAEIDTGVYMTGGFTDGVRTNPVSLKATLLASSSSRYRPAPINPNMPIEAWVDGDSATAKTLTVEIASDTTWQDDEIWAEFEYPTEGGTSSQYDIQSTRPDPLATPANITTSLETWTGGAPVATEQKLSITVTPDKEGLVRVVLFAATGLGTEEIIYINPVIMVT